MAPTEIFSLKGRRIWVAGHRGMVGSALVRRLALEESEILTVPHAELDLLRQAEVEAWMARERPEVIYVAAARVGGIHANSTRPAEFLYENLMIEANIIHAAHLTGVAKLVFLGSSCIYPRAAPQPIPEDALLTGPLEPTNEAYAVAKIAGIKLCQAYRRQYGRDFISAMPTNLYGPGDNYDPLGSHVAAALIAKTHKAKVTGATELELWGSGTPLREFLHADDLADALVFLTRTYSDAPHVNVGTGVEVSIRELADIIGEAVGFQGRYVYDSSKPDGMPRKLMDSGRLRAMGWAPKHDLHSGFTQAYRAYLAEHGAAVG
ncbi:MAG: GDP-L-fucose synthase [Rhodospirillales bacterium]|nr:GDP-L-fucose synthase [Rhodospirillales bacterium]